MAIYSNTIYITIKNGANIVYFHCFYPNSADSIDKIQIQIGFLRIHSSIIKMSIRLLIMSKTSVICRFDWSCSTRLEPNLSMCGIEKWPSNSHDKMYYYVLHGLFSSSLAGALEFIPIIHCATDEPTGSGLVERQWNGFHLRITVRLRKIRVPAWLTDWHKHTRTQPAVTKPVCGWNGNAASQSVTRRRSPLHLPAAILARGIQKDATNGGGPTLGRKGGSADRKEEWGYVQYHL